jgi:3D (Asp-Asp-Asp) domain-containing protein
LEVCKVPVCCGVGRVLRKITAVGLAVVAGCVFYQPIEPSMVWHPFEATAYCDYGFTASGVWVREGIVAGDPRVLPLGSVIDIRIDGDVLGGYEVMDTGGKIKGYIIDIWMPTCEEAVAFGRREVRVRVRKRGDLKN